MPAERSLNYLRGILDELLAIQQRLLSTPLLVTYYTKETHDTINTI